MKIVFSIFALVFCLCFFCPQNLSAELYSWTDENGVRHFSNTPPPEEQKLEDLKTSTELEYTPTPSDDNNTETKLKQSFKQNKKKLTPADIKQKPKTGQNKKVVMYSANGCGYCTRAKAFFKKHNIQLTEYNVDQSSEAKRKFKAANGRGVPLIFIGNKRIAGFDEKVICQELGL